MLRIPGVRRAWNLLLRRQDISKAVEEELDFHLELTTQELITAGLDPISARAEAERRFGDRRPYLQDCLAVGERRRRSQRRRSSLFDFTQDLRFAFRTFRRTPALTLTEIGTLAVGIGGVTVMFSLVSHILLSPLPYREPDRIVALGYFSKNYSFANISEAEFWDFRSEAETLDEVVVVRSRSAILGGADTPDLIRGVMASGDLFPMLGVSPLLGRWFTSEDAVPGAPDVIVISRRLWQDQLGGVEDVIGREIRIEGAATTVIGVMPGDFFFPAPGRDFWAPLHLDPAAPEVRNNHRYRGYAKLADGVTLEEARAEIESLGARMVDAWPQYYLGFQPWFDLRSITDELVGTSRLPLLTLLGAVFLILLIAGANVAGLQLARGERRRREVAIRGALGADRGRVVKLILVENLLLALIGGLAAVVVAWPGIEVLRSGIGSTLPRIGDVRLELGILLFTLAVTVGIGLVFGLLPALQAARHDPNTCLQERGRSLTAGRRRLAARKILVATEVALALTLSISAGIMFRSLSAVYGLDLGFQSQDRLTLLIRLPVEDYPADDSARRARFYQDLVDEVARLPGVRSAAIGENLPLADGLGNLSIQLEGREVETVGEAPTALIQQVTPDWLETMGIRLVRGRAFTRADRPDTRPVAMINETMARMFWPDENPIGKRVRMIGEDVWMEIVGITGDIRHEGFLNPIRQKLYVPIAQAPDTAYEVSETVRLVVRASAAAALIVPIRDRVRALDGGVLLYDIRTMEEVITDASMFWRVPTLLLGVFGALALLLAAIGTYGLVAHTVGQRTQEIGIRVALGADRIRILGEASRYGIYPAAVGLAIGVLASLATSRLLVGMLYGIGPMDPPTYIAGIAVLAVAIAVAALLPAVRILRIDPVAALREE
jgi:putative ABC transport system permease protein